MTTENQARFADGDSPCMLEWGAISLPVGDPSRITETKLCPTLWAAIAEGALCGFDWRVYPMADVVNRTEIPAPEGADEPSALDIAREALDEIALAGMSGTGQESEEGMRDWHARQAWKFIGIAARAIDKLKVRAALAAQPQAALAYQQANPLGGPAKVFRAMADAIEAGDSYEATLRRYGYAEAKTAPAEGEWRCPNTGRACTTEDCGQKCQTITLNGLTQAPPEYCQGTNCRKGRGYDEHSNDCLAEAAEAQGWTFEPQPKGTVAAVVNFSTGEWQALLEALSLLPPGTSLYTHPAPAPVAGWDRDRAITQIAAERIALLQAKYASGWTAEQEARFEALNADMTALCPRVTPAMMQAVQADLTALQAPAVGDAK